MPTLPTNRDTSSTVAEHTSDHNTLNGFYNELSGASFLMPYSKSGALTVSTGVARFRFPVAATLLGVSAAIATAPTGASVIVDVHKNGTTVYTTQGNRPTIAISANAAAETVPDVTTVAAGDYLTVDVDQIGSTIAGSDLTVFIRYRGAS